LSLRGRQTGRGACGPQLLLSRSGTANLRETVLSRFRQMALTSPKGVRLSPLRMWACFSSAMHGEALGVSQHAPSPAAVVLPCSIYSGAENDQCPLAELHTGKQCERSEARRPFATGGHLVAQEPGSAALSGKFVWLHGPKKSGGKPASTGPQRVMRHPTCP